MSEFVVDQITPIVGEVRSVRVCAQYPAFGIQHDSIAVLAGDLTAGQIGRTELVSRLRRHDVGVQRGRSPDGRQLKPPPTGAAPAARIIQHSLDQHGGLVRIDGQTVFDPYVVPDHGAVGGPGPNRFFGTLVSPRSALRHPYFFLTLRPTL